MKLNIILSLILIAASFKSLAQDGSIRTVRQEDIRKFWVVDSVPITSHKYRYKERISKGGCLVLSFIIESDGTTSNHRTIYSFPNDAVDDWIVRNFQKNAKFKPSKANHKKEPVFTLMTFITLSDITKSNKQQALSNEVETICGQAMELYWEELLVDPDGEEGDNNVEHD